MAVTNMGRAGFYLESRFLIDREQADTILQAWLLTFDTRSMPSDRRGAWLPWTARDPVCSRRAQNIRI